MRQQGHDQHHQVTSRSQSVKSHPFRFGKRLAAFPADVALFLPAMDANIPSTDAAACRTSGIRAKYGLWVHWLTLICLIAKSDQVCQWTRFRSSSASTTI